MHAFGEWRIPGSLTSHTVAAAPVFGQNAVSRSIVSAMRIVIVFNPISGSGRAAGAAERAALRLRAAGHEARTLTTRLEPTCDWLDPALIESRADLLVVAGGDGAMRMAAPAACRCDVPVYHLPLGTENLFAREFGMDASPETLVKAIERQNIRMVDVGLANGRWFLLMASVGFDAEVVRELASTRGGSIRKSTYIAPIIRTMRAWTPPILSVQVDGQQLVSDEPGMAVAANSRQYGWRIDPAGRADISDGLLDVVFMPARSLPAVVMWTLRCRLRRQFRHRGLKFARGRHVTVTSDRVHHYQLDGDPPGVIKEMLPAGFEGEGHAPADETDLPLRLQMDICPARLRVLGATG
jgi:diacylglycerol kinase family enzyme